MTETETETAPDRAARITPAPSRGMRAAMAEREWLWRMSGLVLGAVVLLVIAALTLMPVTEAPIHIDGLDKIYHFVAFAALIFPLILTDSRRWAWAVPLVIAYGGAIELIQATVGRSAEWLDFGADVAGVLAGAALAELLHDRIRASVFAPAPEFDEDLAAEDEEQRLERMRADLMSELRVVLREELASVRRPGQDAPVGPSPAEDATPPAEPPTDPAMPRGPLRH